MVLCSALSHHRKRRTRIRCKVYVSNDYYRHNSVVNIGLVVNATMLTFFLIMVKLSLYDFIRSYIQNIKNRNGDALMEYAKPLWVKKIVKELIELWL